MRLVQNKTIKGKLSNTLRGWLPILQADIESLYETLDNATKENPFVEIKSGNEVSQSAKTKTVNREKYTKNSLLSDIDSFNTSKESLFDVLQKQIVAPLFPTKKSKNIAFEIIENINDDGYFEADVDKLSAKIDVDAKFFERVRLRFKHLEPSGVGAVDLLESFLFQLNNFELEDDLTRCTTKMIKDFENLEKYQNDKYFTQSLRVIKKFHNPPAIAYKMEQVQIIPDIIINSSDNSLKVELNESYYPDIVIDLGGIDNKYDFVKEKVKEASSLIDALEKRKATLTKVALMIIDYQYEFFNGGAIKPMKLDDLAGDLERHHSTISRAISNKYISCERGLFPIKSFFTAALGDDGEISNSEIKDYIKLLIKEENRKKPLSDNKILKEVEEKFQIKIGRRTVTKYRMQAGISSSTDRKKLYAFT